MLDKRSKYLLKRLNKENYYDSAETFSKIITKYTYEEVLESLFYLRSKDYINALPADNTLFSIEPTYEGLHYFEFQFIDLKDTILKSVFIPIGVSAVTSLITIWLTNIFLKQ